MATYQENPVSQQVAVIGLGTGTMAAYAQPGQHWTFYEIDPAVIRIAQDTNLFTYLHGCSRGAWDIGRARRARRVEVVDERDGVELAEDLHGLARRVKDGGLAGLCQERLNFLSRDHILDQACRRGKRRECCGGVVGLYADRLTLIGERGR